MAGIGFKDQSIFKNTMMSCPTSPTKEGSTVRSVFEMFSIKEKQSVVITRIANVHKKPLLETVTFLSPYYDNRKVDIAQVQKLLTKPQIATIIYHQLRRFYPLECNACNACYIISIPDTSCHMRKSCFFCGIASHDCEAIVQSKIKDYACAYCSNQNVCNIARCLQPQTSKKKQNNSKQTGGELEHSNPLDLSSADPEISPGKPLTPNPPTQGSYSNSLFLPKATPSKDNPPYGSISTPNSNPPLLSSSTPSIINSPLNQTHCPPSSTPHSTITHSPSLTLTNSSSYASPIHHQTTPTTTHTITLTPTPTSISTPTHTSTVPQPAIHTSKKDPKSSSSAENKMNRPKRKICHYLANGICKFGATGRRNGVCPRYHPELCIPFVHFGNTKENGCNKGSTCLLWHPPYYCKNSAKYLSCDRPKCQYYHHPGCVRPSVSQNKTTPKPSDHTHSNFDPHHHRFSPPLPPQSHHKHPQNSMWPTIHPQNTMWPTTQSHKVHAPSIINPPLYQKTLANVIPLLVDILSQMNQFHHQ